jgi:hypothetical protein
MSLLTPGGDQAVIVRGADAEVVGGPPSTVRLLADASSTGGALTSQRVTACPPAATARRLTTTPTPPNCSTSSAVPSKSSPARPSASPTKATSSSFRPPWPTHSPPRPRVKHLLIVLTPGIERFGYFRLLERLGKGEATLDELLESQDLYDNHFLDSPAWRAARPPHDDAD